MKLLKMLQFAEPLTNDDGLRYLSAYVQELQPKFTDAIEGTDFSGTPLEFVLRMISLLQIIHVRYPDLVDANACEHAERRLEEHKAKINEWIGHDPDFEMTVKSEKLRTGTVWIPLVEHEALLQNLKPEFASLCRLSVDVSYAPKHEERDELVIANFGDQTALAHQVLVPAVKAAKSLFHTLTRIEVAHPLRIRCWLSDANVVVGESLEAGLSASVFTELLKLHQHRQLLAFRDNVAITGKVDPSGKLYPIDMDGLQLKILACRCSPIGWLIVPREQEELCRRTLAQGSSNEAFGLNIIGVSNLMEIFYDRRLTDSWQVPYVKQAGRRLWRHRRIAAAVTFCILLGVIAKMWYGPIDKQPADIRLTGEMMEILNKRGERIQDIWVGKYVGNSSGSGLTTATLDDVDNDGKTEAIWGLHSSDNPTGLSVVYCQTIGEDAPRWSYVLKRDLKFPHHPEVENHTLRFRSLLVGDFDGTGKKEVFVNTSQDYFPTIVLKLDAGTGKELGCYVHIGGISGMEAVDLNSDGITEILLCGVNNALEDAFLAVLDPRLINGHSPLTENYEISGVPAASEIAYIRIPRMGITVLAKPRYRWLMAQTIQDNPTLGMLRVHVFDDCELTRRHGFYVNFDYSLKPVSIGTDEDLDMLVKKLIDQGVMATRPDNQYWAEYMKRITYWDGHRWYSKPTLEDTYVDTVRKVWGAVPKLVGSG